MLRFTHSFANFCKVSHHFLTVMHFLYTQAQPYLPDNNASFAWASQFGVTGSARDYLFLWTSLTKKKIETGPPWALFRMERNFQANFHLYRLSVLQALRDLNVGRVRYGQVKHTSLLCPSSNNMPMKRLLKMLKKVVCLREWQQFYYEMLCLCFVLVPKACLKLWINHAGTRDIPEYEALPLPSSIIARPDMFHIPSLTVKNPAWEHRSQPAHSFTSSLKVFCCWWWWKLWWNSCSNIKPHRALRLNVCMCVCVCVLFVCVCDLGRVCYVGCRKSESNG